MKTINTFGKILMGALSVFALSSCDDFLNREPLSSISPEGYYSSDAQLKANVIYLHQQVLPSYGQWSYGIFGEDSGTDNQIGTSMPNRFLDNLWKTSSGNGDWEFSQLYHYNFFFQQVLPKYEAGEISGNAADIKHCIGEVYFFRAYWYFKKVLTYGDFPIITEPLPDDMETLKEASKRSAQSDVVRFIIEDLDKAIPLLEATTYPTTRVGADLARLLKGRVALYEATWLQNFKGTAFVPGGSEWPGAKQNPNYAYKAGSIDEEITWLLGQAMDASKALGDKMVDNLTENKGYFQQSTSQAANPYFEMYASTDLSKYPEVLLWRQYENISTHNVCVAANRGNYQSGLTRGYVQNFLMLDGTPAYTHGTEVDGDGYYMGDKSVLAVKTNRDQRLSIFLKHPGEHNVIFDLDYSAGTHWQEVEATADLTSGDSERTNATGYQLHKGGSLSRKHYANGGGYTSYPLFRGAEALLIYMEASYLKNGNIDATADKYWKALRKRAGVDTDYNKTIAATDMAKEAVNDWGAYSAGQVLTDKTLYNIRRERRCEFLAEGLRMMDLRRWRSLDQLMAGGPLNGFQFEGFHLWGTEIEPLYTALKPYPAEGANVSSKDQSEYIRPFQALKTNTGFNGATWHMAHYLSPIGIKQIILCSPDGKTASESTIYQNPYWPTDADASATK